MADEEKYLTVKELAKEFRVHPDTVRRAYWNGRIPAFKLCGVVFFDLKKVLEVLKIHGFGCAIRAGAVRIGDSRPRRRRPKPRPRKVKRGR